MGLSEASKPARTDYTALPRAHDILFRHHWFLRAIQNFDGKELTGHSYNYNITVLSLSHNQKSSINTMSSKL